MPRTRARAYGPSVELIHCEELEMEFTPRAPPTPRSKDISPRLKGMGKLIQLDPETAFANVPSQIREALKDSLGRMSDLFRAIDDDGTGTLDRREFVTALQVLGLKGPQLMTLFDAFDVDGSGEIEWSEMSRIIKKGEKLPPAAVRRKHSKPPPKFCRLGSHWQLSSRGVRLTS